MQPEKDNVAFDLQARRVERGHAEPDAPEDAKDRAIAELRSQVTLLRRELARRDDVLMFLAGMVGSHTGATPATPEDTPSAPPRGSRPPTPARPRDGARRSRTEAEKPPWPALPQGYRVVATASDAWVLVARGVRVAGYRSVLDPEGVAGDAWEHHRRNGG